MSASNGDGEETEWLEELLRYNREAGLRSCLFVCLLFAVKSLPTNV